MACRQKVGMVEDIRGYFLGNDQRFRDNCQESERIIF
jgi:hypothetical protein